MNVLLSDRLEGGDQLAEFEDKVVVVTGGSSGIGRTTAIRFGEEGAKVSLGSRSKGPEGGESTHSLIRRKGGEAIWTETDVRKEENMEKLISNTIEEFGRLDVIFNNAGIFVQGSVVECSLEDWERTMAVHLRGTYLGSKKAIQEFQKQGEGGCIVNVSSTFGFQGVPNSAAYCAAKGGIANLTRQMAVDLAEDNIRVNAIAPGQTKTPMTRVEREDPQRRKFLERGTLLTRFGEPEDQAEAVLFLADEKKAGFITGTILFIDGGWMAGKK